MFHNVPNVPAYTKPGGLGPAPPQHAPHQLRLRPPKAQRRGSGKKPLINLLIKQRGHLCLRPYLSKISTMIMNLAPSSSPGMADIPEECQASWVPPPPKDGLGRGCEA